MPAPKKQAQKTPREKLDAIGIDALCEFVAGGESLAAFCKKHGLATSTTNDWLNDPKHPERSADYARAREARADLIFESLDEVSNQAVAAKNPVTVQGLRLKADNIKWKLARMHKKYSDRTVLSGDPENPILPPTRLDLSALSDDELRTLAELQRKAEGRS